MRAIQDLLISLTEHKGRKGKIAVARASFELSGGLRPCDDHSGIDWDYWLSRWLSMTRSERLYAARNDILPFLYKKPEIPEPQPRTVKPYTAPQVPAPLPSQIQSNEESVVRSLRELERSGLERDWVSRLAAMAGIEIWPRGT
jgi:hypothetical protein